MATERMLGAGCEYAVVGFAITVTTGVTPVLTNTVRPFCTKTPASTTT